MTKQILNSVSRHVALIAGMFSIPAGAQESVPDIGEVAILSQVMNWEGIAQAVAAILVAWLMLRFVDRFVDDLGNTFAEQRLLLQRLNAFFHFFVYITTVVIIVKFSFDFSNEVIAVIGGTIVVAIGFATRDLMASIVAGVMIIFDRPFQIGDRVNFGGEYGDIKNIGLRSVKLITLDDSTVTIPNNLFLSEVVSSSNSGELDMQTVVDFYVGVDQDIQLARDLIREATATSRFVYLPRPIAVQAAQYPMDNCLAMRLRLKAYVLDTKYEKDFQTDVTLRVQGVFRDNNILPPAILTRELRA